MSMKTYADYPQGGGEIQYVALKEVLFRSPAFVCLDKATDQRTLAPKSGAAINLRRWQNPAISTTAVTEGVNPTPRAPTAADYTGTMSRYAELYAVSRYEYDLAPYDAVKAASDILADNLIPGTRERVRYNAAKAGTSVFYNSASITARTDVNGVITGGRLQAAIRQIRGYKGRTFSQAEGGQAKDGTSPVEQAYYAFCHSDLEPDLRLLPGFKTCNEYPSGKGMEHEFGAYQNVRFFTSPEFVSYENGGAASTTMKATGATGSTSGSADVYPIIVTARGALTSIALRGSGKGGFGNASVNVLDKRDGSDPTGERIYIEADWYDLCLVTSQEWLAVIEVATTRNPT